MTSAEELPIESVSLERGASPAEVDAVREAFASVGLVPGDVAANLERKSLDLLPWQVIVDGYWSTTAAALGAGTVTGAALGLKALCRKIFKARRSSAAPAGTIVFIDKPTFVWVTINEADLDAPDEHWQRLSEMNLEQEGGDNGWLGHDPEKGGWAPPS